MLEIITAGSILFCVLLAVIGANAHRIYVWWYKRKLEQWSKKLRGYSPNRKARRRQKYNHQSGTAFVADKRDGAEHYRTDGEETPYIR